MVVVILSLLILLVASWLMALPRKKNGWAHFVRSLMLLVGTAAPLVLAWVWYWPAESRPIVPIAVTAGAIILNAMALSLAATGWQAVLRRRYGVGEALDDSLFDPSLYFGGTPSSSSSSDDLMGCFIWLVLIVIAVLFLLGVILAGFVDAYLLPPEKARRSLRAALCFAYALPIQAASMWVLTLVLA